MTTAEYAENIGDGPDPENDPGPAETPEIADEARRLIAEADSDDKDDAWALYGEGD